MTLRLGLFTAAASLVVFGLPADAQTEQPAPDAQAEQAADRAVAEARAEVAAEAHAQRAAQGADGPADAPSAVTISDVTEGSAVRDTAGGLVGTVESVDETGAVVSTGRLRAKLPFSSFARNSAGLVISLTKAQLEAEARAAASRTPS